MPTRRTTLALVASLALPGCGDGGGDSNDVDTAPYDENGSLTLSSSAFDDGDSIPPKYTADGEDVSPPLQIGGVPDDAETLTIVVDDPDAGEVPWVHWLIWNLPADTTEIPEDVPPTDEVDQFEGAVQGANDFGDVGYSGPDPPEGDGPHTYVFRLVAVDSELDVEPGAERSALDDALEDSSLGSTTLEGTYEK